MYSAGPGEFGDNGDMQMMPEGVPDEMAAAAAGGGRKKGVPQNNSLIPVTIAALNNAQLDQLTKQFMHGPKPLQHIELVGVPVQVIPAPSSRSVTILLDDGSGRIEVAKVLNEIGSDEELQMYEKAASGKKNGAYLRVFGKLIEYRSNVFAATATRQVTAHLITKVDDANLLTWTWARAICQKIESDTSTTRAQWEQSRTAVPQSQQQSSYGQSQSAPARPMQAQPQPMQSQPQQYGGYMQQPQQQVYQQQAAAPQQFMNMQPQQQQQQRGSQQFMQQQMQGLPQTAPRQMQAPQQAAYHDHPASAGQMAMAQQQQRAASMQSKNDHMLSFFRQQSQQPQFDAGVPLSIMAHKFNMSLVEMQAWMTQMSQQGLVYSTLDDQHWKCQRTQHSPEPQVGADVRRTLTCLSNAVCGRCSIGLTNIAQGASMSQ